MPKNHKSAQKILDISLKLFNKHGFENVRMQDIVDKLATYGLSKGAIYHYFDSKDDILESIFWQYEQQIKQIWQIQYPHKNGRDKIKTIIMQHLDYMLKHKAFVQDSNTLFGSFRALGYRLKHNHIVPIVESLIEEGNNDGSLNVAYPKAASQMLVWGVYVWLDSALYPLSQIEYTHKVRHLRIMCEGVGLSVIDEEISSELLRVWQEIARGRK
ncbi:TetR/AcrR family transcriptional regulator [Helicobacter typhlonius]|uniref:TetR/AcrR family transcriptional regulator n=1 Tax=Helicobacter typhlonius TaxID=76936 RepID=UPI000EDC9FE5|nr:TetR/AcrR family transcriptional regulator [Helicobacter sp.]